MLDDELKKFKDNVKDKFTGQTSGDHSCVESTWTAVESVKP